MANCIVTVHKPEITEEERQRRLEEFKRATAEFMAAVEKGKEDGKGKIHDRP